ncbi:MAG TPA: hypothetical protein VLA13_00380 [Massilibacterium sp.]|nr:hypothetical protein [Massilibacterium sp.]
MEIMDQTKSKNMELSEKQNGTETKSDLKPLLSGGVHILGLTERGLKDEELANAFKKMIEAAHEKG